MKTERNFLLFYNDKSGKAQKKKHLEHIQNHFSLKGINLDVIHLPISANKIKNIIRDFSDKNDFVAVAAGGDGTISLIANALVGTEIPLGIIPLGTGNLLAEEMHIPLDINQALEILSAPNHRFKKIDAFKLDNRYFILNLSVGLTSQIMERTKPEEKRRLGIIAYMIQFFNRILGLKLRRYQINIDHNHRHLNVLASEILITNGSVIGKEPFEWSEGVKLNDGILDIFIIRAASIFDIFLFFFSIFTKQTKNSSVIQHHKIEKSCKIESKKQILVQADGDPVGKTPIDLEVIPKAIKIIIPNVN